MKTSKNLRSHFFDFNIKCINNLLIILILVLTSCFRFDSNSTWTSEFYKVSIEYKDPMKLMHKKLDNENQLLVLCFNSKQNQSITIKIDKDLPIEQLSNETYYNGLKQTMLKENIDNNLLYEKDTLYHGQYYHSMVFYMNSSKGERKMHCNILRKEGLMYSVQLAYPCRKEEALSRPIPIEIITQDRLIKIIEK